MDKQDEERKRAQRFAAIDRWLVRSVAIMAVLLALSQLALHFPAARHLVTPTEHWEGIRYPAE